MRKFTLSLMHAFLPAGGRNALPGKRGVSRALLGLSLGMALTPLAGAATSAQQQLLEQVRLGEATHREDLVRQSLYRLELIDPNDPQVIAARFRYLLRQGDSDGAQKLLDRLAQLAPESTAYQSSRTAMLLSTPQGRQSLQEARLLATTGHTEQAIASYDKLFKGYPPEGELAVEYWTTVAKLPARRHEAINQLQKINAVSPGNNALQNALAQLLFASGRRDEGFAVLKQMAKSSTGRSAASAIWYQQIKDLPVSDASVKALQDYLTQFSEGDSVSAARAQLSEQQKQLADPAFRARSQGIAAVNAGEGGKAIAQLQQAVSARQDDSEAVGALGQAYSQRGDRARAVAQFEKALAMAPHSSSRDKWESLLKVNRYWLLIQQGDAALKANNLAQAERFYQQARAVDNTDSYAVLGLGDVAMARKDNAAAERYYQQTLRMDSGNTNAVRGLANLYRQQSPQKAAAFIASLSASQRRSIDDIERSLENDRLAQQAETLESAMVLRDAAAFQAQTGEPQRALETYKEAMVAAAITPVRPLDNDTFTRLTRNDEKDDWLKRGVRSDAAELYRQQDLNVTLAHDYWGSSGTGGYSDLKAHTTMLQVDAPWSDGRAFFRTDMVNMDVGRFSTDADGKYDNNWGTCTLEKCSGHRSQADTGASVAVGWQNETWRWDIGTTPMGFNVVDVVGGVSYSDDIGPLGYTLNAHRRPISSSLLAFGGQKDASSNTGTKWGGVRANGGGVSLSYDKGEANGVWASLSGDQLSGKNVEDNWRVRWMTGYYYKVINENNRRVTVGLNNMIWHYDKDLSGYSLGQGGYYSPQEYLSFAVPVMWRQRTENWSWELGGSVSWSHSRNRTMPRYPLMNLIPADYQEDARDQTNGGGSSQGFGYTARALIERRVTANWFVGTAVDIQQAKDYTPSHLLLYVRYSAAGWQGDMDLPPQPLVPYADW
ncbi:cellulose synthase subunit BcsC [Salmonella enterica subsp. enterica serovar Pullorum str. 19945]|nr:cellulose synthase complex outer membrane protein BcsC [Salmonella enterica]ESG08692.1 cellulose synthase subunit BcsC [Salmonella enterica subsp. enterica serovar Pullorum str. 19945]